MTTFLSGVRAERFEAIQGVLVPRSKAFDGAQQQESRRLINEVVGNMPPENQRKLSVFLLVIDLLAFVRGFKVFRRLSEAKQQQLMHWLYDNPVGLLRKGFWGLNTVAKLGVYGQSSLHQEIGYQLRENPND